VPEPPLRVLQVSARFLPEIGGVERHIFEIATRLPSFGVSAEVLTTDTTGALPRHEVMSRIKVTRVAAWPRDRDYHLAPEILSFIRQGSWDIVHVQGAHTLVAPLAMAAARRARTPYVVSFHSGGHSSIVRSRIRPLQWLVLRPWLRGASALVAVSRFEQGLFSRRLGLAQSRLTIIPNGSDIAVDRSSLHIGPVDHDLILSVGRVERYKGHWRLVEAMPRILAARPTARLRVVGDGPDRETLLRRAADLGVAEHVEIAPIASTDRAAMVELLSSAGVVALLSDYEAQGISAMEALGLGRPVVVADSSGLRELATNGWARAIPINSSREEVAIALLNELDRPPSPNRRFPTWDDAARRCAGLYREVLGRVAESSPQHGTRSHGSGAQ